MATDELVSSNISTNEGKKLNETNKRSETKGNPVFHTSIWQYAVAFVASDIIDTRALVQAWVGGTLVNVSLAVRTYRAKVKTQKTQMVRLGLRSGVKGCVYVRGYGHNAEQEDEGLGGTTYH